MAKAILVYLILLQHFHLSTGAKILLLPVPHYSSINIFSLVAQGLQESGHDAYLLTIDIYKEIPTKMNVKTLVHDANTEEKRHIMAKINPTIVEVLEGKSSVGKLFSQIIPLQIELCKDINDNKKLIANIKDLEFDMVIVEGVFHFSCMYVIPYRLDIRYISITFLHDPWSLGLPTIPSKEPVQMSTFSNHMSFYERAVNMWMITFLYINPISWLYSKDVLETFAPNKTFKSFMELRKDSEITLVTLDEVCLEYPRLSAPDYRFIGSTVFRPGRELPYELKVFADSASHGLIVMSFGSVTALQSVWSVLRTPTFGALRRLTKFKAIIQYNKSWVKGSDQGSAEKPDNVLLVDWLPQNDLLAHRNTKVFITHGGRNGQYEAIYHGVPVLTIPCGGDQLYNGQLAKLRGYGLVLDRLALTEDMVYESISLLINNNTFKEKVNKCSAIFKSMPTGVENTVFWVNHLLEHGGDHLKGFAPDLPLYQLLNLDIILLVISCLIILIVLFTLMSISIFKCCCHRKKKQD